MFISLMEIVSIALMTLVVGFIFMDYFKPKRSTEDILDKYLKKVSRFDWSNFWFSASVAAPAIILHEFGHKIVAMSFGLGASIQAAYLWLAIAVVLKLVAFPFIFFVPAYTSIIGAATYSQQAWIAFAGPAVNLLLFLAGFIVLKISSEDISENTLRFWTLTKNINLFLFIFNMLPIPGFDGFTVYASLWHIFGL